MAKAISIQEPYASLIANGLKQYETRSKWNYKYRGEIYIHASAKIYDPESEKTRKLMTAINANIHPGHIVAKATLVAVYTQTDDMIRAIKEQMPFEYDAGFYEVGRKALVLKNVQKLKEPIPEKGHLGVWDFDDTEVFWSENRHLVPVVTELFADGYDSYEEIEEELRNRYYCHELIERIARKVMDLQDIAAGHY